MNPDGSIQVSQWQLIMEAIALFWPIVVAVVVKPTMSSGTKALIAFVLALLLGAVAIFLDGRFNIQNIQATLTTIFLTSAVMYARFWHPTGVAPVVERTVLP